jgi:hypothetical protein
MYVHAANHAGAFAEIDLRVAGRMGEWNEDLARPGTRQPHVILHNRVAAGKVVFDPQPFKNPLRRVPLVRRCRLGGLQDRVDDRNQRPELRLLSSSKGPVPCCVHSRAAPSTGTSWKSSPGSIRKSAPPRAGSSPRRIQTVEPLRTSPLQTSPAPPPNQSPERFSPKVVGFYSATPPQNAVATWPTFAPPRTPKWCKAARLHSG